MIILRQEKFQFCPPGNRRCSNADNDVTLIETPANLLTTQSYPASLVEEALDSSSVLIFGQRRGSLSGGRRRGRPAVPEQAWLCNFG